MENTQPRVRVRFAPSPTGPLHIGGVRTALYNYLFAKKYQGDFLLRIEDTDQARYVPGAEAYIIEALQWCGIPFDEGVGKEGKHAPYRQSERKALYREYADRLISSGHAYYAFDSAESLENVRKECETSGETFIYNHKNRLALQNSLRLSEEETQQKIDSGEAFVIRFKSPENRILEMNDIIRGEIQIDTNLLDDKVLFKSDGMPTYHLANIVDDHLMEISHVIRGEEWLPSMALHVLLYEAFGWNAPKFAHLSLLLKPEGKGKLSKRDGDKMGFPVFPLQWQDPNTGEISRGYREDGYLPEAVVNMLALLGWNSGTEQEIFSLDALIREFSLERVHKSGAKFDPEKTKWFQHQYIQKLTAASLTDSFKTILEEKGISTSLNLSKIVNLVRERITFVSDIYEQSGFFFSTPENYDETAVKKAWNSESSSLLNSVKEIITFTNDFRQEILSENIKLWITNNNIGFGKIMQPLRIALVGEMKGPDLFAILEVLGKEESIRRLENAIKKLG